MKFSIKDFHPWETADLVTFTGEILNGKYHFCGVIRVFIIKSTFLKYDGLALDVR